MEEKAHWKSNGRLANDRGCPELTAFYVATTWANIVSNTVLYVGLTRPPTDPEMVAVTGACDRDVWLACDRRTLDINFPELPERNWTVGQTKRSMSPRVFFTRRNDKTRGRDGPWAAGLRAHRDGQRQPVNQEREPTQTGICGVFIANTRAKCSPVKRI